MQLLLCTMYIKDIFWITLKILKFVLNIKIIYDILSKNYATIMFKNIFFLEFYE